MTRLSFIEMFILLSDISLNGCILKKMKTDFGDNKWLPKESSAGW